MLRRCPMLLFATVALVCLFSIVSTGQSQPSLGEVAKQKSSTKKARRIITDDDMPQRTPEPAASSA
ncbi:MAG TPA: hypothetical protein VN428_01915, partial [Bryobacteraceae bacterium]|nr:hypothetical protein [Bryobacteraceae bacterium]